MTEQIDVGGKRSHVEILRAGLEEIGWRVHLVDWATLSYSERVVAAGGYHVLERFTRGLGQRWLLPVATFLLRRRVRDVLRGPEPPSLIHVQEPLTYFPARAEADGRPVVLTIHGPSSLELRMMTGFGPDHPSVRFMEAMERTAYRGADLVISVDQPHAAYVTGFGRPGPIPVIPNFVDTRRFHPALPPGRFPDAIESWLDGRAVALVPRRLVPKNGVDVAIRAARLLADRGGRVGVVIAGEGPQRAELETLARSLDTDRTVRFLGEASQDRIVGWYRRADVVLVPSVPAQGVEEATSISALEGQAVGRPVIASRVGGLPEIVEHEVDGLLVPPKDPAALADAMDRILDDRAFAASLGERAAARVHAERSHVHGAERYAELYSRVLGLAASGAAAPR
jgi:glycosyltransferase involved in cell wall biosynthesis